MELDKTNLNKKARKYVEDNYSHSYFESIDWDCPGAGKDVVDGFEAGYKCALEELSKRDTKSCNISDVNVSFDRALLQRVHRNICDINDVITHQEEYQSDEFSKFLNIIKKALA